MQITEKDIEYIDSYIKGELSKEEIAEFEFKLSNNESFKMTFEYINDLRSSIKVRDLTSKLDILKKIENDKANGSKKNRKLLSVTLLLFVLTIMAYFLFSHNKQEKEIAEKIQFVWSDEEWVDIVSHSVLRGDTTSIYNKSERAYNLFAAKQFTEAEPMLMKLWIDDKDTLSYYYLSVIDISYNRMDEARKKLNSNVLKKFDKDLLIQKTK